ncbi:MAG: FeoB-associated Cys-rich membrane protein [Oscillospiraceae bacterium]|nr:FeoB-associated Cys-rich membrane protein [Oscillospiraceae bacterium]
MTNIIVIAVLLVIIGVAAGYVIKEKKSGKKCIGCPHGGSCNGCAACDKEEE